MSVLIKGIGMPTGNDELRLIIRSNGQVIISHKTYFDETEAILVPPHGRLIDADALMETFRERKRPTLSDGADGSKERVRYLDFISTLQAIKDAPAIIEAEVEE